MFVLPYTEILHAKFQLYKDIIFLLISKLHRAVSYSLLNPGLSWGRAVR